MSLEKRIKKAALLLAVIFALTVFGAAAFEALCTDHECCGEECTVCAQLTVSGELLSSGRTAAMMRFAVLFTAAADVTVRYKEKRLKCDTLISLKVMILD